MCEPRRDASPTNQRPAAGASRTLFRCLLSPHCRCPSRTTRRRPHPSPSGEWCASQSRSRWAWRPSSSCCCWPVSGFFTHLPHDDRHRERADEKRSDEEISAFSWPSFRRSRVARTPLRAMSSVREWGFECRRRRRSRFRVTDSLVAVRIAKAVHRAGGRPIPALRGVHMTTLHQRQRLVKSRGLPYMTTKRSAHRGQRN